MAGFFTSRYLSENFIHKISDAIYISCMSLYP